ncbi:MAG TPA: phosphatidate cytidylyltransferase [Allosphingosinicella sp.]|nr:phosphatidate cytidylyltransferase [Allosphingosinicella sp.]
MSDGQTRVRKSDLPIRFVASVAMIAVATAAVYFGGWLFRGLTALAAIVMIVEWGDMHRVKRLWSGIGAVLVAAYLLVGTELLYPVVGTTLVARGDGITAAFRPATFEPAWWGFGAAVLIGVLLGLASRRATLAWGFVYIAVPAFALLVLSWNGAALVFWVLIVTWSTDIFAYFAGRSIGGPKLAPRISPNKTWAGLIGGMLGAAVLGWFFADLLGLGSPFLWLGAPMGLIAQAGDLYESWVKRRSGVKDSGHILPGHGGVLDRLDGLLAVVAATMLFLMTGLWTA